MPKFSWKKVTGLSKIKSDFARKTGIPTTKSGRKRKIKKMATGGGCAFIILVGIVITIIIFISRWLMNKKEDEIYCPECGKIIKEDQIYCEECGKDIIKIPEDL